MSVAAGAAAGGVVLALVRLESVRPLRLLPAWRPEPIPDADWRAAWPVGRTPADIHADGLDPFFWLLLALGAATFAVAAANLVILAATRASDRRREYAVRAAVGATGGRLAAGSVAESLALGAAGLLFALPLARAAGALLEISWPAGLGMPPASGIGLAPILLAGGPLVLLILAAAALPAFRAGRSPDLRRSLRAGGHATADARTGSARDALAVIQVAALLALLSAGGVLVRHAAPALEGGRTGYEPDGLFLQRVSAPAPGAATADVAERTPAIGEALLREVAALPEVHAESIASPGTLLGLGTEARVHVECRCVVGNFFLPFVGVVARQHAVGPAFFRTAGVPVLSGREFGFEDGPGAAPVAVISRAFAERHFGDGEPIGRTVQPGSLRDPWYVVIGIVEDVHPPGPGAGTAPGPVLYVSALQHPGSVMDLVLRGAEDAVAAASPEVADSVALAGIEVGPARAARAELAHYAAPLPWFGRLYSGLAIVGLLLAVYGLAAVMVHHVARRRREIGIRLAVGASPAGVRLLVARRAARLTWIGCGLGFLLALGSARGVQLLFPGVRLFDPVVFAAIAAALAATALAASWVPGTRAARLDPLVALRAED